MPDRIRPTEAERYAAGERKLCIRWKAPADNTLDRICLKLGRSKASVVSELVLAMASKLKVAK
jgi:hypothetical protein